MGDIRSWSVIWGRAHTLTKFSHSRIQSFRLVVRYYPIRAQTVQYPSQDRVVTSLSYWRKYKHFMLSEWSPTLIQSLKTAPGYRYTSPNTNNTEETKRARKRTNEQQHKTRKTKQGQPLAPARLYPSKTGFALLLKSCPQDQVQYNFKKLNTHLRPPHTTSGHQPPPDHSQQGHCRIVTSTEHTSAHNNGNRGGLEIGAMFTTASIVWYMYKRAPYIPRPTGLNS